jgi:hypothetical protein
MNKKDRPITMVGPNQLVQINKAVFLYSSFLIFLIKKSNRKNLVFVIVISLKSGEHQCVHGSYDLQRCDSIASYENFHCASCYEFEKQGHPKFEHQSMKLTIKETNPSFSIENEETTNQRILLEWSFQRLFILNLMIMFSSTYLHDNIISNMFFSLSFLMKILVKIDIEHIWTR